MTERPSFDNPDFELLATLMADGFARVEERLDAHDARFEAIEGRLTAVEKHLGALEEQLGQLAEKGEESARLLRHELRELRQMSIPLGEQDEILARLRRLETHLNLPHEIETAGSSA